MTAERTFYTSKTNLFIRMVPVLILISRTDSTISPRASTDASPSRDEPVFGVLSL